MQNKCVQYVFSFVVNSFIWNDSGVLSIASAANWCKKNGIYWIDLPLLQFDQVLDLQHYCERCRDAYQQRRDSPCSVQFEFCQRIRRRKRCWRMRSQFGTKLQISVDCFCLSMSLTQTHNECPIKFLSVRSCLCSCVCEIVCISVGIGWQMRFDWCGWKCLLFYKVDTKQRIVVL